MVSVSMSSLSPTFKEPRGRGMDEERTDGREGNSRGEEQSGERVEVLGWETRKVSNDLKRGVVERRKERGGELGGEGGDG